MRLQECPACEIGDHANHQRVVHAVSPGMLGGVACPCKGECGKDPEAKREAFLDRMLGPGIAQLLGRGKP